MKFVDYYKIMGLDDSASESDIKKAYRRLARKYHPDVSKEPDAELRFKEIGEAYSVLKHPDRKREYDELKRYNRTQGPEFNPPPDWHSQAGFDQYETDKAGFGQQDSTQFSDFFEQIFRRRHSTQSAHHSEGNFTSRGQDMHTRLSVSLHDAYHGSTIPVSLQVPTIHPDGSIRSEQKSLRIKVPKGVTNGQTIRLQGQGGAALGDAAAGDLYIELTVEADEQYHLNGKDILTNLPLTPWEAALGASVSVPTLGGQVKLTIPANSRSGQKLRLKGRGMPGETPGDQYVTLMVVLPEVTNEEQKALYEKMRELWSFDPRMKTGD